MIRVSVKLLLLGVFALALAGCGAKRQLQGAGSSEVAQTYLDGLVSLQAGDYNEALRLFQSVATSPRYLSFTALAALRAADSLYYQGLHLQAIEAYRAFLKLHAGNPNVPYAEFRIAQCHFRRMPGSWWFMPPAHERELGSVQSAYAASSRFLSLYPNHRFAPEARNIRAVSAERLYAHEMYAAQFYERRGHPRGGGAAHRGGAAEVSRARRDRAELPAAGQRVCRRGGSKWSGERAHALFAGISRRARAGARGIVAGGDHIGPAARRRRALT
jgi:outer membrane protein assembly factor BamD